jgi:signal transduction histidine kinase
VALLALAALLSLGPVAPAAGPQPGRLVVVLYPNANDGRPGNLATDRGIRAVFTNGSSETIEVHSEFLDVSAYQPAGYQQDLAEFLRKKYAGRKVELVIAGLAPALDFALKYRDEVFPGVPIVFCAIDQREVKARSLPPDVIGVPIEFDLAATLDLALRLHPDTRHVFVVAGKAPFDTTWEAEARRTFRAYEPGIEFVYLTGLPLDDILTDVGRLPEGSIIYYLHVLEDGTGKVHIPSDVLTAVAARANAPVYGHVDTYVGRGIVGGRVFSFETAGQEAAGLGLRILAGQKPESIGVQQTSENAYRFDARQLRRWGISEGSLPAASDVRYQEPTFWDLYRWHIIGVGSLCIVEALLIVGLLVQRMNRREAIEGLRESQRELRVLTGRLLQAQETERRRIARELHDDLNQSLALLAIDLDVLGQRPPESAAELGGRMRELSARVKQLSAAVHDLSYQLHPSKLEQLGLLAAVRGLCKELSHHHGLPIEFTHHDVPETFSEDVSLCLYRIAQEALQNVVKHSGARHAGVELRGSADTLCLRIADDGKGFDPGSARGKEGLGLVSMRERLRLLGGAMTIDSRPAGGTRIEVHVPLQTDGGAGDPLKQQPARTG